MALTIYNPATGANIVTLGVTGVSPEILMLNVLIELRVANLLALEIAKGNDTVTLESLRQEVVTEATPATS